MSTPRSNASTLLHRLLTRLESVFREPVNSLTHLFGAATGIWGTVMLLVNSTGSVWKSAVSLVFGLSFTGLFTSSGVYHWVKKQSLVERFQRLDHMMIYFFIAGSYTPFCIAVFDPKPAAITLSLIWAAALTGAGVKYFRIAMPRWFSTLLYVILGWAGIFLMPSIRDLLGFEAVVWILAGGVFYTVGAVIYALKKPDFFPKILGFHELWHVFVLAAGFCHLWAVYRFVIVA
jgi:hemolysin III